MLSGQDQKCGSGLARECGVSVMERSADTPHSRASPLPQFDRVRSVRSVVIPGPSACPSAIRPTHSTGESPMRCRGLCR
ncbi:hypothetical protein DCC84_26380 [Pseudomonas sp. SXM-1]|nr:hypothetical protein DCC84_26380 [Pseudomonas sp. SXM-1]